MKIQKEYVLRRDLSDQEFDVIVNDYGAEHPDFVFEVAVTSPLNKKHVRVRSKDGNPFDASPFQNDLDGDWIETKIRLGLGNDR